MTLESAIAAVPVMLIVWAVLTACFVALLTYRGQLTRYEQERLFLTNINPTGEREQSEIVKRINQVQPYVRVFGVLATVVTVSIVALWTADAWKTLHS
jgi:ABC-type transport system involved in cytochrome c biogenesis permease subunit